MIENITGNIYTFPIRLPRNPLQYLNSYVIKATDGGRSLLIDTGFKRNDCLNTLLEAMRQLKLEPDNTDVFITHFHSDHSGNLGTLYDMGFHILCGRTELEEFDHSRWPLVPQRYSHEGMPERLVGTFYDNPSMRYMPEPFEPFRLLDDGDILSYGGHRLQCLFTPGHSMGHMCLWDCDNRVLFTGDHLLYNITPNITCRCERRDILHIYLDSLRRIMPLEPELVLPGHRSYGRLDMRSRAAGLIEHHSARLKEALEIVCAFPGLTGYEVSGKMAWHISTKSWENFPPNQTWFAMGEGLAHLDYLLLDGSVVQREENGILHYYPAEAKG